MSKLIFADRARDDDDQEKPFEKYIGQLDDTSCLEIIDALMDCKTSNGW